MTIVVVDSSSIISCATNCLLWVFDEMQKYGFKFIVPKGVKDEVIDGGLMTQKYKFEALRVMRHFTNNTFTEYENDLRQEAGTLLNFANSSFRIKNQDLKVLQEADAEVAVLASKINADAIMTDEITLRLFIENTDALQGLMQHRFHTNVKVDNNRIYEFKKHVKNTQVIRSADLVALAIDLGIFDLTINTCLPMDPKSKKDLIEGVLYALRFSGCGISFEEINDYVNLLLKKK